MDFRSHQESFARDGFAVVRGFLPADEFVVLQSELDRYIRDVVPALGPTDAFYQDAGRPETLKQLHRMSQDPYFNEYRRHPRWVALAETLLGERAEAEEPEWFNKPPGAEHATPPHQDNQYFNLTPPQVLTMWLALDRVDEENGALRYATGSHLRGRRLHGPSNILGFSQGIVDYGAADAEAERLITMAPGDLVVHHGETIHRADPNRSTTRSRRAFAMVFRGASCRVDEAARAAYQANASAQRKQYEGAANA